MLTEHFADHRSESKGTSLLNFLVSHYCTEDGTDPDADEDSKLPFKTPEQFTSPGAFTLGLPISAEAINRVSFIQVRNFLIVDDDDIPSLFLDSIWQPPRSC